MPISILQLGSAGYDGDVKVHSHYCNEKIFHFYKIIY